MFGLFDKKNENKENNEQTQHDAQKNQHDDSKLEDKLIEDAVRTSFSNNGY